MDDHRTSTYGLSRGAESSIQPSATREWEPRSYDSREWNSASTQNEPEDSKLQKGTWPRETWSSELGPVMPRFLPYGNREITNRYHCKTLSLRSSVSQQWKRTRIYLCAVACCITTFRSMANRMNNGGPVRL